MLHEQHLPSYIQDQEQVVQDMTLERPRRHVYQSAADDLPDRG